MPAFARTAAAALLLGLSFGCHAAASQLCDSLGFQLATLAQRVGPTEEARKYARAIAQQKRGLRELGFTARKIGCSNGSVMVIGGPNEAECSKLAAKKSRMERNLEILENKRVAVLSQDTSGLGRQRLVSALKENRCNEQPVLVRTPGETIGQPLVHDDLKGLETIQVPSSEPNYNGRQFVDLGGVAINGNYRTMCVRTCDGAYFPVSSHASPMSFRRDAQVCSMMCPGTETELYYHSVRSESEAMRSTATGKSYDQLKNAFRFRTQKPGAKPECGCNFALYYKEMMKRQSYVKDPASIPRPETAIIWTKPELRSTLHKADQVASNQPAGQERSYVPNEQIRRIGPAFLPDQGIDFTKPLDEIEE